MRPRPESGTICALAHGRSRRADPWRPNADAVDAPTSRSRPAARASHWLAVLLVSAPVIALAQTTPAVSTIVAFSSSQPNSAPVRGPDGALYGTTSVASSATGGLIYRAEVDGTAIVTLHQLTISEGYSPVGGLILGSDGQPLRHDQHRGADRGQHGGYGLPDSTGRYRVHDPVSVPDLLRGEPGGKRDQRRRRQSGDRTRRGQRRIPLRHHASGRRERHRSHLQGLQGGHRFRGPPHVRTDHLGGQRDAGDQ